MKLILSKFDLQKKIKIIYSLPNQNISDEHQNQLKSIYEKFKDKMEKKKQFFYDYGPYLSYIFKMKSAWFPEEEETIMLTLYFQDHENTKFFKDILAKTVLKLTDLPNLTKILYLNTPHTDNETYKLFGKVIQILTDCFFEVNQLHATYNLGLAEVLILGGESVGKTAIVDYLIHNKYIPQKAPTLTPQVYNLFFEETDFRVLDVCCDEHIKEVFEDHPIEPGKLPQAIVYVVDTTLKKERQERSIAKFKEWIRYLERQYPPDKFIDIPILVLFNKIDLNPYFDLKKYEKLYRVDNSQLNIKYDEVSALNGEGILENFEWLFKRVKVTEKL